MLCLKNMKKGLLTEGNGMKKHGIILLVMVFLLAPAMAQAVQFSIVGPRALGMGGASVAAVNDSTAVYWNPAALADFKKVDIRVPVSAAIHDHIGLRDTMKKINDINAQVQAHDPAAINEMITLLNDLNKPDTGADVDASAGLFVSIPFSKSAIAISALGLGYAGLFPTIDTVNVNPLFGPPVPIDFVGNNNSAVTGIGIVTVEPAVSFATSFGEKLFIGANVKMIQASTYLYSQNIRTGDFSNFISNLNNSETRSNKPAVDAGILFAPIKSLNLGVVGRNLNSPKFPLNGLAAVESGAPQGVTILSKTGEELELERQYRAGIAWKPFSHLTVSADYDLSKNKTLTPGFEDQTVAAGVELTLPKEIVSFRGGLYKNTADSNSNVVYTAGLGFRIFAVRLDLAGAYDFDKREGQASVDVAVRF
jgi:hypothetical protein